MSFDVATLLMSGWAKGGLASWVSREIEHQSKKRMALTVD